MIGDVEPSRFFRENLPLFDLIKVPIFVVEITENDKFIYRKLNQSYVETSGVDEQMMLGQTPHDCLPKRTANTVQSNYLKCLRSQKAYSYEELSGLTDKEIWWSTTLSPVRHKGRIFALIGVAMDITRRKRSEKRIAESLVDLHTVNRDLEVLTATTAHDLRGPLRQAKIVNEMLLDGFQDQRFGESQAQNQEELLSLTGDIVDRALHQIDTRLEKAMVHERSQDHRDQIDFGHYFRDLIALLDPLERLEASAPDRPIECEYFILDIALRNLVDNAVKHASSRIAIEVSADDGLLEFAVSDDGAGFNSQMFTSGELVTVQPSIETLSGFGLSSASKLIKARGGQLWVAQPQFGCGATIRFTTPGTMPPIVESQPIMGNRAAVG